jgi:hypothetical protein
MSPRPILKQNSAHAAQFAGNHAVHFPPSPSLTRTFTAPSPMQYDRSPIQVTPNNCALPERGCPGRTYTLDSDEDASSYFSPKLFASTSRGHLHPRALAARQHQQQTDPVFGPSHHQMPMHCPPLIPDLSSSSESSEESDGICSPIPPSISAYRQVPYSPADHRDRLSDRYPSSSSHYATTTYDPMTGSVQPSIQQFPPSSYATKPYSYPNFPSPPMIEPVQPPARRRRPSPKQKDSSRRRGSPQGLHEYDDDPGYDDDADIATPTASSHPCGSKRRGRKSGDFASMQRSFANFTCADGDEGDGCLGGF